MKNVFLEPWYTLRPLANIQNTKHFLCGKGITVNHQI